MTRIVGGALAGRRLRTPAGAATRPTGERVREALANSLAATGGLTGARVLDLYAGSGALGLELTSRGAATAVLVESDPAAVAAIRGNVADLGLTRVQVVAGDVAAFAARPAGQQFDIVVADPPYRLVDADLAAVLAALGTNGHLAAGADLIVERGARAGEFAWPAPMTPIRTRRYGDTVLCYGRAP